MEVMIFCAFLAFTLAMIALGFYRTEHTELTLAGFLFLFFLALILMNSDLQYKTGESYQYGCLCCGNYTDSQERTLYGAYNCTEADLNSSLVVIAVTENYETFTPGGFWSHQLSYWLAITAIVGFIGVFLGMRKMGMRP